jgi:two-component system, OmpR family, sensor histidine kinase MprB
MTLRARLAILTAGAVALAIIAASVVLWGLIRASLLSDIDRRLLERSSAAEVFADGDPERFLVGVAAGDRAQVLLNPDPLGLQVIAPDGSVTRLLPPGDVDFGFDTTELAILAGDSDDVGLRTVSVGGDSYRVMSVPAGSGGMLRMIQPLAGVEATMARIAWLLAAVSAAGIAVAGGLGWATARGALRPVGRLAAAAERVATTKDLSPRLEVGGDARDEIARLATTFNEMLDALEAARSQQRELVENASHELRTPLTTLRNDVALLLRSEHDPHKALEATDRAALLSNLEAEAVALSDMVAEVVDLARGDVTAEPLTPGDLLALAERAAARSRRLDASVTVRVTGKNVTVPVRPGSMERAIANLIRNAVQASDPGGIVEVVVGDDAGWGFVEVLDRGAGIADKDLPRIFDRFYRGDDSRRRHGSGLGLAIVAQVAEQHSGTVVAGNRPEGGAAFTLRLPVSEEPGGRS